MRKIILLILTTACILTAANAQQSTAPEKEKKLKPNYKVEYSLVDMQDGKTLTTHNYTVNADEEGREASIRIGTRVPITSTNDKGPNTTYLDIGLNVDCRIIGHEGDTVQLDSTVEMNNFVPDTDSRIGSGVAPAFRTSRSRVNVTVPLGKKSVIGSYDDINSTRSTLVVITVTRNH